MKAVNFVLTMYLVPVSFLLWTGLMVNSANDPGDIDPGNIDPCAAAKNSLVFEKVEDAV